MAKHFGEILSTLSGNAGSFLKVSEDGLGFEFQKTEPIGDWVTSYVYYVGDLVLVDRVIYRCITQHTSGTFSTDSSYWEVVPPRSKNRIFVGANGQYATLKEAVDYFNSNATTDIDIYLDSGHHLVTDTITVNNSSHSLLILGNNSYIDASTGLTGKPMFNLKSECVIRSVECHGETLSNYGTASNENCITLDTTSEIYVEINDIIINNFKIAVADLIGTWIYAFNFTISNCPTGIYKSYSTTGLSGVGLDAEIGTLDAVDIGINLNQSGGEEDITLIHLIFNNNSGGTSIVYNGGSFLYSYIFNIFDCTYNNIGTFISGYDFSRLDGRDADIEFDGNNGVANTFAFAQITITDNTTSTTLSSTGTFYKILGINNTTYINFDSAATGGTFTITYDGQTTTNIAYNASTTTIKSALEALSNITNVTVTQLTASKEWNIKFNNATEGWNSVLTINIGNLSGVTSATINPNFINSKFTINDNKFTQLSNHIRNGFCYITANIVANSNNQVLTIGIKKNGTGRIICPMTVRTSSANNPYPFGIIGHLGSVLPDDYFELYVSSATTNGVRVYLSDVSIFFDTK